MNSDYLKQLGDAIAMAHWAKSNETTYEEICDRVVNYICDDTSESGRHYNHRMKDLLKSKKFIPNSPCWINAGTDMKNLFACYVIDLQDNMSSIMDTAKRMAMIMKEGGGVGVSLTPIREEGARVGGEGSERTASGPISFLKVFDAVVGAVKSAGVRRGAALANLKVGHPDLIKFIKCKEDQNQINNFNLSVAITDEFMDDVINKSDKIWAVHEKKLYTATEIYDLIVEHMWRNGEPGVQFIDAVNNVDGKYTGRPEFREFNTGIEVSNPCVTGDTLILTDKGYFPIKDLVGKKINIWNGFEWSEVEPRKTGENQKLLKITFSNGSEVRCTPYHKFIIQPLSKYNALLPIIKVEAKDLKIGDKLLKCNWPVIEGIEELKNAYTQGFFSGDGSYYYGRPTISFYGEKVKLISDCAVFSDHKKSLESFSLGKVKKVCCRVDVPFHDKSFVPDSRYTIKSRLEWLAGLCDSDGSLNSKEGSVSITSINKEFLININKMLNTLGISGSVLFMRKACDRYMPDGKGGLKLYKCKDCYRLIISAANMEALVALGFHTKRVKLSNKKTNRNAGRFISVIGISDCQELEDVFCLTEHKNHSMIINGVISSQCGESFLKPNEACNLGSINLYHFVRPFWEEIDEDTDIDQINQALRQELKQTVEDAVDFLNLMLDKSETPFDEINKAVKASRKVGLGVMGLADYLSAKGLVYGSPEAIHEAADIFAFITKTAEEHSLRKGYKNACLTIQAPTGTTGLVGEVSTGIEPHFLRCWTRHSLKMGDLLMYPKSLRDYIKVRRDGCRADDPHKLWWIDLEKAMKNNDFKEFSDIIECDHETVMQANLDISNEIKRFWPTAHEVTPKQHLAMLAAIQRHVHNSVSKTINLPHDATVDDVRELITTAWRTGVKGFTCYRDGSRDSQPLKSINSESKDKIKTNDDLINHIRLDMTEEKRMEYLEKMSDEEPIFADTILKSLAFDKILKGMDKTLLPAENIILSDTEDSKIFADKIRSKMVDDLQKELKDDDNGDVVVIKKDLFEAMNKFSQLGYDAYVDQMSDKLANSIMKDNPEIWPDKGCSQEQKASCKRPRPAITYGESIRTKIGCGTMYITVNKDDRGICEVFTSLGRKGGCPSQSEATSRLISLALRSGVKIDDIIDQLKGIRCLNTMRQGGIKQEDGSIVLSCPDAIGKALERVKKEEDAGTESFMKHFIGDEEEDKKELKAGFMLLNSKGTLCPKCGEQMDRDGGCVICRHCGYSKCG